MKERISNFKISYEVDAVRQGIADSWPQSIDDTVGMRRGRGERGEGRGERGEGRGERGGERGERGEGRGGEGRGERGERGRDRQAEVGRRLILL